MKKWLILLATALVVMGCIDINGTTKVSATGTIYECLIVCPNAAYPCIEEVMGADMPCLPQMEPYFKLTHVTNNVFDDFLKPTRNILVVEIDSMRYTAVKAKITLDCWSHPQAVYQIHAPSREAFATYWAENGMHIRDWFVRQEIDRQASFYEASTNHEARNLMQKKFHVDMWLPKDYEVIMNKSDFLWTCNNKGIARRDVVIYSYPYTDVNTFTLDYLCAKRDSVLGQHVTATVKGSYMGTEYAIFPPQLRELKVQKDGFAYEVRGLWKIYKGEAMGGPFVSLTRLDEINHRVITAEVFVYAAGQSKRNELRKAEAILYTLQLEQELNVIPTVQVTQ